MVLQQESILQCCRGKARRNFRPGVFDFRVLVTVPFARVMDARAGREVTEVIPGWIV